MTNRKIVFALMLLFTLVLASSVVSAGFFDSSSSDDLNVSDIKIVSEGYSMYKVNCEVTPKKEYDYLQMGVIFYDSSDAVIGKSSLAWNVDHPTKNQLMKVSGTAMTDDYSTTPVRAEVYFVDSALDTSIEHAVYAENVTM